MKKQTAVTRRSSSGNGGALESSRHEAFRPPMDIFENDKEFLVVADMPGVSSDELEINVVNNQLKLRGMRAWQIGDNEHDMVEYRRTVDLDTSVDADKVKANFKAGVLSIHLPKTGNGKAHKVKVTSR